MKRVVSKIFVLTLLLPGVSMAATGKWNSQTTGTSISYTASQATGTAAKDQSGKPMTVVYMENLGFQKTGQVSNADNVAWLRQQGWQVIELDYGHSDKAVSPALNKDIIAINSSLQGGKFLRTDMLFMAFLYPHGGLSHQPRYLVLSRRSHGI